MRKDLLTGSILTMMLIVGAGCSVSDKYCCESNDLCDPVGQDLYSCSVETCQCVLVQPITVAVVGDWKDPMVKQDNYRIELQATGGLTPYIWKDFTIVGDTEGKLSWLTLQEDANDPSIAYLTNRVENGVVSFPNKETTVNDVLVIKVTVLDNSKHGTKEQTVDNFGYVFEHRIEIRPSACESGDGFCPADCTIGNDDDCLVRCGDGVVSSGETCDTAIDAGQPGACPASCDDQIACTTDTLQDPGTCRDMCVHTMITQCNNGDGCCPVGCNSNNDNDCKPGCGNGILEKGEDCDYGINSGNPGACPTSCDDGNACTVDSVIGDANMCTAKCNFAPITTCKSQSDGCCPTGCNANNDSDCTPKCGNGVVEAGETCDGNCPTSCNDGNVCTNDVLSGSAASCTAKCTYTAFTPCCGNGTIEAGEDCDPPNSTTCDATCHKICLDMMGTWISRVTTTGTITEPYFGTFTGVTIDVVQRMYIHRDTVNDLWVADFEICSLASFTTGTFAFSVTYSPAVIKSMVATGSSPYACYFVNDTVTLPSFKVNTGWNGTCDTSCICPTAQGVAQSTLPATCCGAIDSDGDGAYGITLPTSAFGGGLKFTAYAGLTMDISLSGMKLTDANTTTGTTAFPTTGYIFGSTAGAIGDLTVVPTSNAVPVTAIKLDGNVDCATVLTHCTGAACVP